MKMNSETRGFRVAFVIAMTINVLLIAALGAMWRRSRQREPHPQPPVENLTLVEAASPPAAALEPSLAPMQISPQRLQSIGVRFGTVQYKIVHDEIRVSGNVEIDEKKLSYIQVRFPGWIRNLYANATWQYIRKGQPLFTIYSPDLVTTEREYLLARQNEQKLQNSSVPGVAGGASSLVGAARERLDQWQVPASEIDKLEKTGKVITDLTFHSPVSGYITEKNALPNMYVQPETRLYTVADLSTVWVYANVFQTDLGKIRPGGAAQVTVDSYPDRVFEGRIDQILPQVDMNTRTARVRLVFANPGLKLTPGMYVNVTMRVPLGRQLTLPSGAVFHSGTRQIVFINHGEGNLEPREVQTLGRAGDDMIVTRGLKAGDSVVSSANFLIDSEAQLQAAAGAFAPPASPAPHERQHSGAQPPRIEFSSSPSPPHRGNNTFQVKVVNADGSPVTGAQVTVIFFMPAMPSMGMAAMKTTAQLTESGAGNYEGRGELGSGGTWQVTITVVRNGETLGRKQFSINAEGGM